VKPLLLVKALLKTLLLPPIGLLLLALIAVMASARSPRLGRGVALGCLIAVFALAVPEVATALVQMLGVPRPFEAQDAAGAGAVVILSGGVRTDAPDYGGDTVSTLTLERLRYGARVARMTGLPVLVSGGAPMASAPEAELMKSTLEQEFHVPVRWVEAGSDNTHENAQFSAAILRRAGVQRVILVTHAFDVRRAVAEFEHAGISVVPAATNLPGYGEPHALDWVPSMGGLLLSYYAMYEIGGNIVRGVSDAMTGDRPPPHDAISPTRARQQ